MAEEERRGEGFLSRWSRLKQARREEAEPPPPAPAPAAQAAPDPASPVSAQGTAPPELPGEDEPEIDLASLPPLEALTARSDLSQFLRKGVPEALKNAALRRVWSLDPDIRDFIGPADYAWNWNVPGGAPGYMETIAHGPDIEALADRILGIGREAGETAPQEAEAGTEAPQPEATVDVAGEETPAPPPAQEPDPATPVAAAVSGAAPLPAGPASPPARPRHGGAVPA
jgi:hypothetical protein